MPTKQDTNIERIRYIMKMLKRLAAGIVSVAMAATMLTGCDSGRYVMNYDGNDINSGIYIYNVLSELLTQQYNMYMKGSSDSIMDQKVDGKEMAVYLEDKAMEKTKAYCAVTEKFKELGLELTDDDNKSISTSATNTYNAQKDMFEEMGISKESIKLAYKGEKMKTMLFDYYYGKDGKEAPSDEEMEKYVTENYLRYKSITISKSTKSDDSEKEKENKEKKEQAEKYFKQAEGKSFSSFDDVIDAYKKDTEAASAAANGSSSTNDSSSSSNADSSSSSTVDSSSSSAADSSSSTDSSAVRSDSSKVGDNDSSSSSAAESSSSAAESSSSKAESSSSAADSSSSTDSSSLTDASSKDDTSSAADSSAADSTASTTGTTETEASKYPNETMINYANFTEDQLNESTGKMAAKIKEAETGKAFFYEDDTGYYIIIKGDTSERSKGYASENHSTLLSEKYDKIFDKTIADWAEKLDIKVDSKAIKRYSAKSLYNRYVDFLTKDSSKAA